VKLFAFAVSLTLANAVFAHDAKSDCQRALDAAKRVGLPISPNDFPVATPTKDSILLEKLIAKAEKIMRRNQPSLGESISNDLDDLDRKRKGKPPIVRKAETAAQKEARMRDLLIAIQEIGKTKGPRISPSSDVGDVFVANSSIKAFLTYQVEGIEKTSRAITPGETIKKLRIARRLVELTRKDATAISLMMLLASEQKYYALVARICQANPTIRKAMTIDLLAPFPKPSFDRMLQEEFAHRLSNVMVKSSRKGKPVAWNLPKDTQTLKFIEAEAKGWTVSYGAMKGCRTWKELEDRYKAVAPKLNSYKFSKDDELVPGPAWAESASRLDKAEAKRLETIKLLGLR